MIFSTERSVNPISEDGTYSFRGFASEPRTAPTVLTPHAGELARLLETESAEVEGSFSLEGAEQLDLKITTRGLSVPDMRSFGVAAIPLLDQTPQGHRERRHEGRALSRAVPPSR